MANTGPHRHQPFECAHRRRPALHHRLGHSPSGTTVSRPATSLVDENSSGGLSGRAQPTRDAHRHRHLHRRLSTAARYTGLRYLWWTLAAWQDDPGIDRRVDHYLRMIINSAAFSPRDDCVRQSPDAATRSRTDPQDAIASLTERTHRSTGWGATSVQSSQPCGQRASWIRRGSATARRGAGRAREHLTRPGARLGDATPNSTSDPARRPARGARSPGFCPTTQRHPRHGPSSARRNGQPGRNAQP